MYQIQYIFNISVCVGDTDGMEYGTEGLGGSGIQMRYVSDLSNGKSVDCG